MINMKYTDYQIVFREIPNEVTLAINISNCPNMCEGCHSPELRKDIGENFNNIILEKLIKDNPGITCVCFMGGDRYWWYLKSLSTTIRSHGLKSAWYSGKDELPNPNYCVYDKNKEWCDYYDYIKIGHYDKDKGPLDYKTTNQRLYEYKNDYTEIVQGLGKGWKDITSKFW